MERGLRQGDPMSHFLFLIAAEGLHALIERSMAKQWLTLAVIGKEKVRISHLQYADDTIFTLDENERNATVVKNLLNLFHFVSGLGVNFNKSSLYSMGVDDAKVQRMAEVLNCKVSALPFKYLGVMVGGRNNSVIDWNGVVEKVRRKIDGWEKRKLSLVGRITLIKAVLQGNSGAIAWIKWDVLCSGKSEGGLGFRNLEWFSSALVSKWVWRYLEGKEALWVRVVRSVHGEQDSKDRWRWNANKVGSYTTKSAYAVIAEKESEDSPNVSSKDVLAKIWKVATPYKVRVTAWRCLKNRLATCDNLLKRNMKLNVEETCSAEDHGDALFDVLLPWKREEVPQVPTDALGCYHLAHVGKKKQE
ncbi:uncharacterized protein LOC131003029 [Salvia miltiorrhiza]|uniref:uncharacterized protein LOC131003029 n=1 Tax=Salvia miltiorrhiza TaxID=226208 RepID=UPI0025AD4F2F|nr:uncharacterized protein LOC131003029 [Salvia miltiorrhiza]